MQQYDDIGCCIKVACTPKELSCIVANLFSEVKPLCDICETMRDEDFVIFGLITGTEDDYAIVRLTDFGFEFYGDTDVLENIRKTRCLYNGAVNTPKENGGAAKQGDLSSFTEVSES